MSIITVVGSGMMGSAMSFPARDNGHEVRLVSIHKREVTEEIRRSGYHLTLKRQLPDGVKAYFLEELEEHHPSRISPCWEGEMPEEIEKLSSFLKKR